MSRLRKTGIFVIFVYCIVQVLAATTSTKPPENQFTITVTNIGADSKPSIIILDTSKNKIKEEKQVDKTPVQDEFAEFEGDEVDYLGAENQPFDESMSFEEEEVEESVYSSESSASSVQEASADISAQAIDTATQSRAPMAQPTNCRTQGQVAITYSEGPSDVTAKIARQLKKADARANFFVNATWLYTQQYAMVLQNLYNAGHFIGMTYRVPGDNPDALTDDDLRRDIVENAHTIETVINVAPKYVRLHYTENKDVRTENILAELGFILVGYNLDSLDYMKKDSTGPNSIQSIYSETFKKYKDTYDAKGSFISIQYDLPYTGSLNAASHIINTIDEEGYTMVRMDGCLNDATPYKKTANGTEYVFDKFSFQQPEYHQGQNPVVIDEESINEELDEEEEEEFDADFKMQNVQNISSTQTIPFSAILFVIAAIFTLFL